MKTLKNTIFFLILSLTIACNPYEESKTMSLVKTMELQKVVKQRDSLQAIVSGIDSVMTEGHYKFVAIYEVEDHISGVCGQDPNAEIPLGCIDNVRTWTYDKTFETIWTKYLKHN